MASQATDPAVAAAVDHAAAGVQSLLSTGVRPDGDRDATVLIGELETLSRQLAALQLDLVAEIDQRGLNAFDGHRSAKIMVRHTARLSDAEATCRASNARALHALPVFRATFHTGHIGTAHLNRIARAYANPRIRGELAKVEHHFAKLAELLSYPEFDAYVTSWANLTDQDGTCDRNQRNHENRNATHQCDHDGSWKLKATGGSLQGAQIQDILEHFIEAEFAADWAAARQVHGEQATPDDLPRTIQQRRYDALHAMCQQAAAANAATPGGSTITTNIVIDPATFEDHLARLCGHTPAPTPGPIADPGPGLGPRFDNYRCSTLNGTPVDPTEAVANALTTHVRRVVIGADNVAINLGRRTRLFKGPAALAARLQSTHCYWPGCTIPVTNCQIDHVDPWITPNGHGPPGGRTDQSNAGPACGHHNRHKQAGYRVHRDPNGTWHTIRPDGTEIT